MLKNETIIKNNRALLYKIEKQYQTCGFSGSYCTHVKKGKPQSLDASGTVLPTSVLASPFLQTSTNVEGAT